MKQFKSMNGLRLLAGGLLWLLALGALTAQTKKIGELYYNLNATDQTAEVTHNSSGKYSGDIVIPESVAYGGTTYAVTSIGYDAFEYCTGLTSIEIPSSVTSIGYEAFDGCTGLTAINVDESNTMLSSIDGVLYNKAKTSLLQCPGGKKGIVNIPSSVAEIGSWAFYQCTGLTSITLPSSVDTVGDGAFSGCTGLTEVTIADRETVLYLGRSRASSVVFGDCPIRTLYLGGNIDYHVNSPFSDGAMLHAVTFGRSVTRLGFMLFSDCTELTSIEIPNSVTAIGYGAFKNCNGLTSIKIPDLVTAIGDEVFYGCTGLTSIEIPNSVTAIGDKAFAYCKGLTSIKIPDLVTAIGDEVFYGCTGLTSIEIPNSVTAIGSSTFRSCTGLTSVTIPNSVTEIGGYAFGSCTGLKEVVLGKSVAYIREGAFSNCINLICLTSKAVVPAECEDDVFYNVSKTQCELIVPEASVEFYKRAPGWKDFVRVTGQDLSDRIDVTALRLDPSQASLRVGEGLQLRAVVTPDSATEQTVVWESSDKNVLRVDNDGYVMAVGVGEAVITARTTDGSDLSATCNIKVIAGNTAVEVPDGLKAVRVYADGGRIEVRGLPLGTAVALSGVDGRLWYQTEAVTGPELTLSAPRGHVYVLRLNHTHSLKVYLP